MSELMKATQAGDELEMLLCLRLNLAQELDICESGRDIAALSRQYMDVSERIRELKKLKPKERKTTIDNIRAEASKKVKRKSRA
jgi:hypothetical protein